jgi:adenylate cyclase
VSSGPVIVQDGDYFGRTVNLAARIAGRAEANEVLASEDVVAAVPDGVAFEEIGPVELRGISRPVTIYRAERQ